MTRVVASAALLALAASAPGQTPSSAAPPRGRGAAPQDERRRIHSDAAEDALQRGFKDPPESARPRVWWHWLNGNVTKEGITADLEWMKRVGIAGMQMFDGSLGVPQFTEKRLVWMTPEWKDAFKHSAAEADRLGLEMAMAASGGWSETAGPWVKPEEGMKKVVWSETRVVGPRKWSGVLPNPPSMNGRFRNIPVPPDFAFPEPTDLPGAKPPVKPEPQPPDPTLYADTAVVAYRVPDDEVRMADLKPRVTTSGGAIDAAALVDDDLSRTVAVPIPEGGKPAWIQYEFAQPFRIQALSITVGPGIAFFGATPPVGQFQTSRDGTSWATLLNLPGPEPLFGGFPVRTSALPETTARLYRFVFPPPPPNPMGALFGFPPVRQFDFAEIELFSSPRVHQWEDKASFATFMEPSGASTPAVRADQAITRANVVDLTSKMGKDGRLEWDAPAGDRK